MELGRFNQLDGRWLSESQGMTHCFSVASVLNIEMELVAPTASSCSMRGFNQNLAGLGVHPHFSCHPAALAPLQGARSSLTDRK